MENYNALNGDEVRKAILAEITRQLADDGRFKMHPAYHRISWKWQLEMAGYPSVKETATITGDVVAKSAEQTIAALRAELSAKDQEWKQLVESERVDFRQREEFLLAQIEELTTNTADIVREAIEAQVPISAPAPVSDDPSAPVPLGEPIVVSQQPVEEPDRVRELLSDEELAAQTIGRRPDEVRMVGDHKAPVEAPRHAVVGRGKRPASVVGRPNG